MSETASRKPFLVGIGEGGRKHSVALLVGTALIIALGALILQVACSQARILTSPGDEPPIRVKGGSLNLELLAKKGTNEWSADVTWIAKSGKRNSKKISVLMLPRSNDAGCTWLDPTKDEVTITFQDTDSNTAYPVIFNVKEHGGNALKTSVTPGNLQLSLNDSDKRQISNGDHGYISSVKIDGTTCTFSAADAVEVVLFEQ